MQPFSEAQHVATLDAIRAAARFALPEFEKFSREDIEYKGKNDLFSYVDVETEKRLKTSFLEIVPGSGFVGEETDVEESENDYRWIVDPIDGTTNFTHGIPLFAISVALQWKGEVVAGYVYEVVHDEMFHARLGQGAFLNDTPIHVSSLPHLKESLIATGFPYREFSWLGDYLRLLTRFMRESHGLRRLGSAAIDLAYVACGRFEGFFEFGLNPWDVAAGGLIVREAGGRVTNFDGGDEFIFSRQLLASNGHIHPEMQALIRDDIGEQVKREMEN